jgi:hypothetical protein
MDSAPVQLRLILPSMARLDLTDEEREELVRELRGLIDGDRFPFSARVRLLKAILDKLDPPKAPASPFPASKPLGEPSYALRRRRRCLPEPRTFLAEARARS